jgi:hypothetical protein
MLPMEHSNACVLCLYEDADHVNGCSVSQPVLRSTPMCISSHAASGTVNSLRTKVGFMHIAVDQFTSTDLTRHDGIRCKVFRRLRLLMLTVDTNATIVVNNSVLQDVKDKPPSNMMQTGSQRHVLFGTTPDQCSRARSKHRTKVAMHMVDQALAQRPRVQQR